MDDEIDWKQLYETAQENVAFLDRERLKHKAERDALRAELEAAKSENDKLRREIELLRSYGNKDCTAQADSD